MIDVSNSAPQHQDWIQLERGSVRRHQLPVTNERPDRDAGPDVVWIEVQDEHHHLRQNLLKVVFERSNLDSLRAAPARSRDDLVVKCRSTLGGILAMQAEWMAFLRRLVRIDFVRGAENREQDHRLVEDAAERCMEDVFSKRAMQPLTIPSPLTAEVISRDVAEAWGLCVEVLEKRVEDLVERMLSQLDALVGLGVCGLVTRYPNRVCRYFYGYRQLDIEMDEPNITTDSREGDPAIDQYRTKYTTKRVASAKVRPAIVLRTHHVMHVTETELHGGFVAVPEFHQLVIRSTPEWLEPMTRLIEGTIIGEQIIQKDLEEFQVLREDVLQVRYHHDPAIILGQYVLAGWGPSELGRDVDGAALTPGSHSNARVPNRGFHIPQFVSLALFLVGGIVLVFGGASQFLGLVALLGAAAAWGCTWEKEQGRFTYSSDRVGPALVSAIAFGLTISLVNQGNLILAVLVAAVTAVVGAMAATAVFSGDDSAQP